MTLDAAETLRTVVEMDRLNLHVEAIKWVQHYIDHNESGLAYDIFIGEIARGDYVPSQSGLDLIKLAALKLGTVYPQGSC